MIRVMEGDCRSVLATLPAQSVQCCVTSPPYYGLRDYGVDGQIGLEKTPDEYVAEMVAVFRDVRRVLRDDGVLWLNLGDSYNAAGRTGHGGTRVGYKQGSNRASASGGDACRPSVANLKEKDLIGIPWMVAFALRADGWYLRSECIWAKPNPMPESVTDRPTKAHEQVFLLSKSARYFYDADAISEPVQHPDQLHKSSRKTKDQESAFHGHAPTNLGRCGTDPNGRNARTIWTIATQPFSGVKLRSDYVGADGKHYRLSTDCPVHAPRATRQSLQTALDGGHRDQQSIHNPGTDDCPVAGHEGGRDAIPLKTSDMIGEEIRLGHGPESNPESKTLAQSPTHSADDPAIGGALPHHTYGTSEHATHLACGSGSPLLGSSEPATPSNRQSHRTDPVPATSPACNVSAQTANGTADTSALPQPFGLADHSRESKSDGSEMGAHPSARKVGSSVRKSAFRHDNGSECLCEQVTTDHFATMPPALAERCIKAGTSERGCCAECGAPWVRVVETTRDERAFARDQRDGQSSGSSHRTINGVVPSFIPPKSTTTGWAPSCDCAPHDPIPCTILDPFGGAGTTALVADRLNRNATIIELNPEYAALARERVTADAGMFAHVA